MSVDAQSTLDRAGRSPGRVLKLLKAVAFLVAAAGLSAMSVAMVVISLGGDEPPTAGGDDHGPLRPAARLNVKTEAGTEAEVLIRSVHGGATSPEVTVTVKGAEVRALQPDAWTFQLDDGNEMAALITHSDGELILRPAADIPAGRTPRFLRFDPDLSRGDMYFEFQ